MKKEIRVNIEKAIWELRLLTRRTTLTDVLGGYKSVFKGKGLEFEYYRDYAPGEDASAIDWKASTRAKKLLVKKYVEERELEVFFLIDASTSMVFGSTPQLKNEYVAELVISFADLIMRAGDKIGMALFTDRIFRIMAPDRGRKHFYGMIKNLTDPEAYGGLYNTDLLDFPLKFLRKGTVLFLVSDFIGIKEDSFGAKLKLLSTKFDTICMMVRDPRDEELVDIGKVYIQDPFSNNRMLMDSFSLAPSYKEAVLREEERIKEAIIGARADFIKLRTDESFVGPLLEFFKRRQRRWR